MLTAPSITFHLMVVIGCLLFAGPVQAVEPPPAPVERGIVRQGIHRDQLRLAAPDSGAALFYDRIGNILTFAPAGARDRAATLATLLDAFFAGGEAAPRYQFSGASGDGMYARLAAALLHDPGWDARRGRAVKGPDRDTLLRVLNEAVPFADIATVWRAKGYELRAVGVEQIMIGRLAEIAMDPGLEAAARVPVSFVIQYTATREDPR